MADFVAVIRRAVDGLSDNTPELRAKVYEKARGAVLRQLESMKPRPPEEMLRRQLEKLENAIREVEAEHAEALPPLDEPEEAVVETVAVETVAVEPEPLPESDAPAAEPAPQPEQMEPAPAWAPAPAAEAVVEHGASPAFEPEPVAVMPAAAEGPQAPAWDDVPAEPAASVAPSVKVVVPPAVKPTLWGDESWADEDEVLPAPAPAPVAAPVPDPAPALAAPAPEPVPAPAFVEPEPLAQAPAPAAWEEPNPFQPVEAEVPVEPSVTAEPLTDPYPDFAVEDPTEKYAAMEPVTITEPVAAVPVETEWPKGGVDAGANARIGEEEWVAPAQYAAPEGIAQPTLVEETGFVPPASDVPADPLAWSPDMDLPPVDSAADTRVHADLAAPAQDYFDEPVLLAEPEPPVAAAVVPPSAPRPAVPAPKPEPELEPEWDILGRELPLQKPQPAPSPAPTPARPGGNWEELPFDDVPLPASGASRPGGRDQDQWDGFEDFDAFEPAPTGRAPVEEEDADLLYTGNDKPARSYRIETRRRFDFTSIGIGLLGLVLVAGSGYGAWVFRDTLSGLVTGLVSSPPADSKAKAPATGGDAKTPDGQATATDKPAETKTAPQETATAEPEIQKFTQRLQADGSEVDEGKADGGTTGEGKSVAEQTVASAEPAAAAVPGAGTPATTTTPDATIPVGVSQKMYLYEERVGQTSPVAIEGAVVWSLKKETGANGKTELIVEAQVSAPERNLSALITFKRNLDPSLPASHLVELVFSIPKEFEGGAIESVQRVALKQTEQDRGDPLIAVPAKITDDFHMIALNDYADARAFNLKLLETRDWIDIPVTYRNGRRALITMEKGSTGAEAFRAAIRDWNAEEGAAAPAPAPAPAQP